jgi:hypothetical protein
MKVAARSDVVCPLSNPRTSVVEYGQLRRDYQNFRCSRLHGTSRRLAHPIRGLGFRLTLAEPTDPSVRPEGTDGSVVRRETHRREESETESRPATLLASAIRDVTARLYPPAQLQVTVRRVLPRPARRPALSGGRAGRVSASRRRPSPLGSTRRTVPAVPLPQHLHRALSRRPLPRIAPGKRDPRGQPPRRPTAPPHRTAGTPNRLG